MLHEEFESTTKVTRQEDKPKPGTGRDQDQGPEPGEKNPTYYYKDRRTASTANKQWWHRSELTWSSRTWGELEMAKHTKDQNTKTD